jgi:hypothetical protein
MVRRISALAAFGFLWLGFAVDAYADDLPVASGETSALEQTSSPGAATDGSVDATPTEPVVDTAPAEPPAPGPAPVAEPPPPVAEPPPPVAEPPPPVAEPPPPVAEPPPPVAEPPPPVAEPPPLVSEPPPASEPPPGTPSSPLDPSSGRAPSIVVLPKSPPPIYEIVQDLAPLLVQLAEDPRAGSRAPGWGSGSAQSGIPLRDGEQPFEPPPLPRSPHNGPAPAPVPSGGATGGASGAPASGLIAALTFLFALSPQGRGGLLQLSVAQPRPFALVSQLNRPG